MGVPHLNLPEGGHVPDLHGSRAGLGHRLDDRAESARGEGHGTKGRRGESWRARVERRHLSSALPSPPSSRENERTSPRPRPRRPDESPNGHPASTDELDPTHNAQPADRPHDALYTQRNPLLASDLSHCPTCRPLDQPVSTSAFLSCRRSSSHQGPEDIVAAAWIRWSVTLRGR